MIRYCVDMTEPHGVAVKLHQGETAMKPLEPEYHESLDAVQCVDRASHPLSHKQINNMFALNLKRPVTPADAALPLAS